MKYLYLKFTGILCLYFIVQFSAKSQGCVAIRSGCGVNVGGGAFLSKNQWQASTNFRYFHSYKHFRGKKEETERVENGTEVINDSFFLDFLVSYGITDRLTVNFTLPFVYHERSSMYEHGGNPREDDPDTPENEYWAGDRRSTFAKGLSDIRISASYWILDPEKYSNTNFSVGLGVKFASGNYKAESTFYNAGANHDETIESGVDQSIQPGDGGVGITLSIQGFSSLSDLTLTTALYYLSNPREQYTLEARGSDREYSVPDQYAARLGVSYMTPVHGLSLSASGRAEGVPSSDLIGGDEGFRRPGHVISVEPGITYGFRNVFFNFTVPIAVERARTQSYSDKQATKETGVFRNGDAAFADYLINFSFSWKFGSKSTPQLDQLNALPIDTNSVKN